MNINETIVKHHSINKIKKHALDNHIPIIMDDVLEKIYEITENRKFSRILEIGTAYGYSAICFANLLSTEGVIDTIERDPESIKQAKKNIKTMKYDDKINLLEGDAVEILPSLEHKYEMVFIDAAKGKYPFFLEQALRLTKNGAIIFADNILYKGYVLSDYNKHKQRTAVNNLRKYIKLVEENPQLDTQILDVGDGLAISKRK